ncbi:MAG: septation protein A [Gammaproteobacteria bacterium]|nr:septation protein A [Gammaproteobacteria bacterium]NND53842.1 septation protein A [Gammaproteobacteria bacterium]
MQALIDFLPVIAFVATYTATKDMSLAIIVIIAAVSLQVAGTWLVKREVSKMLLASAALVIVFGGISLATDNAIFIMWKPTVLYWVLAVVFLGSNWIGDRPIAERMMTAISEDPIDMPASGWRKLNLSWVAFFVIAGLANIYVAYNYEEATWVNFKLFGLFGLTFVFLILQSLWMSQYIDTPDEAGDD